jgi:Uma2 family endonuclease
MSTTRTRVRIGPADHGRRMTLDEFREAEEQRGYLYELARGVLEVSEIPGDSHCQIVHNIHEVFSLYRRDNPGLILRIGHGSDVRFIIPDLGSDRHPDLAIVFQGADLDDRGRRRAAMAVEVVSPGSLARRRDYEEKREEYLLVGLREYWIVDPKLGQVTVLIRVEGVNGPGWVERAFRGGEAIGSDLLPGLQAEVDILWRDIDPGAENEGEETDRPV